MACYDPEGYGLDVNARELKLREGEEILGVYGVKDSKKWLTSLGFIVMRKVQPGESESRASVRTEESNYDLKITAS